MAKRPLVAKFLTAMTLPVRIGHSRLAQNSSIPKDEREELDSDDEFYPDELEGMKVLSPKGVCCGRVIRMEADAPCPYLLVSSEEAGEVMIPFRHDFISSVDKANKSLKLTEDISFHIPVE
jgi:ribosomal 30S subunit maturation factor RimM